MASHVAALVAGTLLSVGLPAAGAQEPAEKPSASLTYRTDVGPDTAGRVIVLLADGPPPEDKSVLVDEEGQLVVSVEPLPDDDERCGRDPLRTTLGDDEWCLRLSGIGAGARTTGRLVGDGSVVELSVEARHDWRNPAWVALASLLLAVGLLFLTTRLLPKWLVRAQLFWLTLSDHGIDGFMKWASDVAGIRLSHADTLARLRWAKRHGKQRITAVRAGLREAAQNSQLEGAPLVDESNAEAAKATVDIGDVLTVTGTVETSAAEELFAALTTADAARAAFDSSAGALRARITDPTDRQQAEQLHNQGLSMHRDVLRLTNLATYQQGLSSTLAEIQRRVPSATDEERRLVGVAVTSDATAAGDQAVVQAAGLPAVVATIPFVAATATAAGVAVVLMAIAAATVLAAVYVPSHTFGTFADYVKLATTALGSSSVAGVLALLLLFKGPDDWYG